MAPLTDYPTMAGNHAKASCGRYKYLKVPRLPSSLRPEQAPNQVIVPPGQCQFRDTPIRVKLLARIQVSPTRWEIGSQGRISSVLRFALPDSSQPLNLSTCACLVAVAEIDGQVVQRPYTPISTNRQVGSFDLLVKHYGAKAKMSRYLHDVLQPGDEVAFLHLPQNVKVQAQEFMTCDHIGMLVGGTGINPMLQALHAILGERAGGPCVTLLYGNQNVDDILARTILDQWAHDYPDRFQVVHILSREPDDSKWTGHRGLISWELIDEYFPMPTSKCQVWICGPDGMYDTYSGPRKDPELSGLLAQMGYKADQVYKF